MVTYIHTYNSTLFSGCFAFHPQNVQTFHPTEIRTHTAAVCCGYYRYIPIICTPILQVSGFEDNLPLNLDHRRGDRLLYPIEKEGHHQRVPKMRKKRVSTHMYVSCCPFSPLHACTIYFCRHRFLFYVQGTYIQTIGTYSPAALLAFNAYKKHGWCPTANQ